MFVASTHSKRDIVHCNSCHHLKTMNPEWRIHFYSLEEATAAGYRLCSCCTPVGKQYFREKFQVDRYCKENSLQHFMHDGLLYIISGDDTTWRIVPKGDKQTTFFLEHENFWGIRYVRRNQPYWKRSFHQQKGKKSSIVGYLKYIVSHDQYIEGVSFRGQTKSPKKRASNPHSFSRRKRGISKTLALIDHLTEDYRMPKAAVLYAQ